LSNFGELREGIRHRASVFVERSICEAGMRSRGLRVLES
jgi:hypothetical protein